MASLQLRKVVKRFGETTVIPAIDLDVKDGEFVVFVGPSGCGKSTLLRMIAGLEPVTEGDLMIDGKRVNDISAAQRGLAMVFQSYALYPHMTVRQNLAFGLENMKVPRAEVEAKVQAAAKLLRLDALLARRPTQLSGGQRQRVAIGRAIVRNPTIFLFDEPLSNLDAELRVQMRSEITGLHDRLATTMIYVTHDQVEAMTMADTIVVLRAGRVEQIGAPLELYRAPANRFVAGFIGSPQMNFLRGRIVSSSANAVRVVLDAVLGNAEGTAVPLRFGDGAASGSVHVGIRPEHVALQSGSGVAIDLPMTVERIEQLGSTSFLYCACANGDRLTVQAHGPVDQEVGTTIIGHLPATAVHLFSAQDGERAL
jgi:multiple sugar transport system ATP-binding protein